MPASLPSIPESTLPPAPSRRAVLFFGGLAVGVIGRRRFRRGRRGFFLSSGRFHDRRNLWRRLSESRRGHFRLGSFGLNLFPPGALWFFHNRFSFGFRRSLCLRGSLAAAALWLFLDRSLCADLWGRFGDRSLDGLFLACARAAAGLPGLGFSNRLFSNLHYFRSNRLKSSRFGGCLGFGLLR